MAVHHPTEHCISCGEALEQEYDQNKINSGFIGDAYIGTKRHTCNEEKLKEVKENWEKQINFLVANEHFYSDEDIVRKLKVIAESSRAMFIALSFERLTNVLDRRITEYCEKRQITTDKYNGVLPNSVEWKKSMEKVRKSLEKQIIND